MTPAKPLGHDYSPGEFSTVSDYCRVDISLGGGRWFSCGRKRVDHEAQAQLIEHPFLSCRGLKGLEKWQAAPTGLCGMVVNGVRCLQPPEAHAKEAQAPKCAEPPSRAHLAALTWLNAVPRSVISFGLAFPELLRSLTAFLRERDVEAQDARVKAEQERKDALSAKREVGEAWAETREELRKAEQALRVAKEERDSFQRVGIKAEQRVKELEGEVKRWEESAMYRRGELSRLDGEVKALVAKRDALVGELASRTAEFNGVSERLADLSDASIATLARAQAAEEERDALKARAENLCPDCGLLGMPCHGGSLCKNCCRCSRPSWAEKPQPAPVPECTSIPSAPDVESAEKIAEWCASGEDGPHREIPARIIAALNKERARADVVDLAILTAAKNIARSEGFEACREAAIFEAYAHSLIDLPPGPEWPARREALLARLRALVDAKAPR